MRLRCKHLLTMLLILSLLGLSGCGFQLRGRVVLPDGTDSVFVQSADPINPLRLEVERLLRANSIRQVESKTATTSQIEIVSDTLRREILSVNERARVSEFLLRYEADVRIISTNQVSDTPVQRLSVSREYSFDERQALGAAQEEEIIGNELRADMAALILQKLQLPARKSP